MKTLFPVLTALLLTSGAIAATPPPVRATLVAPLGAMAQRVDAGAGGSWTCTGAACIGAAANARLGDARACRELAKAAGAVATFTGLRGELSAGDLTKCNKSAKPAA